MPADIERLLDRLVAPRHDLRSALQQFVMPFPADYDWRAPERRYLATYGLYLPRLSGEQIQRLAIDIALSGSIDPEQMAKFFAILREILGLYDRVEATVMTSDVAVHDVWELSNDSPLPTSGRSGGGTAMEPVFEKIEELRLDPYAVLILTDGYALSYLRYYHEAAEAIVRVTQDVGWVVGEQLAHVVDFLGHP